MTSAAFRAAPIARLRNVNFTYRDGGAPALREIDLNLRAGGMIGIMGASGAGKSTLVKCINRLVPAFEDGTFSGRVEIAGQDIGNTPVCELASTVGMVFQDFEAQLFSTSAGLETAFAMQQLGLPREEIANRIGPALEAVGLAGFENRDPTSLSGGEKQRLAIASVLALRPRVIIFDEPTTDIDPEGRAQVLELIGSLREQGITLILIEHEAEAMRQCDWILVLREGEIVAQGRPSELLPRFDLLEEAGVRAPDLNRALTTLGITEHPLSVAMARELIQKRIGPPISTEKPIVTEPEVFKSGSDSVPSIEIRGLNFSYPRGPRVLENIDLTISRGEFLAIVGQNGSGKTTLAKLLVGLIKPSGGEIRLNGHNHASLPLAQTAAEIGYVFQNPDHQIFASSVEDEVAFGPRNFGASPIEIAQRVDEVLEAVNLSNARARDPFLLSKGERQRLAVASILVLQPRILILDEPTTGLDYREQRGLMSLIEGLNRKGVTIIMITHTPWLVAEYARRVVLMRNGRIRFDGAVPEFFTQEGLLRESSFRPPEIAALARELGFSALSVDEFIVKSRIALGSAESTR